MKNYDIKLHVQGLSQFVDDITVPDEMLYAAVFTAPVACGKMTKLNVNQALGSQDIYAVYTWKDIPGKNQIGHVIHDEPLFAEQEFHYEGQPIALVIGKNKRTVSKAMKQIELEYDLLPAVYDPRIACANGSIIGQERIFSCGNIEESMDKMQTYFQ
jgi:xanthine dehydrogenase large subunit